MKQTPTLATLPCKPKLGGKQFLLGMAAGRLQPRRSLEGCSRGEGNACKGCPPIISPAWADLAGLCTKFTGLRGSAAAALRGMLRSLWLLLAGHLGAGWVDARSANSISRAVSERQGVRGHELGRPVERLQVHPLLSSPLLNQRAQLIIGLHHHPALYGLPSHWAEIGACMRRPPLFRRHECGSRHITPDAPAAA